ncbi:MAG: FG-GAP-like repeat-containing protein [Thermoanaerobaculia bacterium]|nr:FG-GAP-like repeat-containing protein [Thermoanaerobaculia bacterium]
MIREAEIRETVRSELALDCAGPLGGQTQREQRTPLRLWRAAGVAALSFAVGGGQASAQAPYQQERIPGFSSLFAGPRNTPELVDLDGDGDLDAVVGEHYGSLHYFANTGTSDRPSFVEFTGVANPFFDIDTGYYSAPALADLDGDGDLDAVVGESSGLLYYFENTGASNSPSFVELTGVANSLSEINVGTRSSPDLVDLDGDGDLDAVVGNGSGSIYYFENTGGSTSPSFMGLTGGANPFFGVNVGVRSAPHLVDLDADGDLDAVVGNIYGFLKYFENTGTASSPSFVELTGTANPFSGIDVGSRSSLDLVDLDGDGDFDATVGEGDGSLNYFENTGTSNSPFFVELTGVANPFFGIDVGQRSNPDLEDLDGDGDLDVVVGKFTGSMSFFRNTGTSNNPIFVELTGEANPFSGIDIGYSSAPNLVDLDSDGDLDLVVGKDRGSLSYFENTGTSDSPIFVESTGVANPFSGIDVGSDSALDLVDLDGDGDQDAVIGGRHGALVFFRSHADDIFADDFESGNMTSWSGTIPPP